MHQRHELKIHGLHKRPHHPVLAQRLRVRALQLRLHGRAFHERHAGEEDEEVRAGEEALVEADAGEDFEVFVAEDDGALEEGEPGCCGGPEDRCEREECQW